MEQELLILTVKRFYNEPSFGRIEIVSMAVLGPGVIAVLDAKNECGVYFDKTEWEYCYPKIWQGLVSEGDVGYLPGIGRVPSICTFGAAIDFSRDQLKPKSEQKLFDQPQIIC